MWSIGDSEAAMSSIEPPGTVVGKYSAPTPFDDGTQALSICGPARHRPRAPVVFKNRRLSI